MCKLQMMMLLNLSQNEIKQEQLMYYYDSNIKQLSQKGIYCLLSNVMSITPQKDHRLQTEMELQNNSKIFQPSPITDKALSHTDYHQSPYRFIVCILFGFINLVNGMAWVVVTPLSNKIEQAYGQSSAIVALVPMSYLICYVVVNFISNWALDVKGIRMGLLTGCLFTTLGTAIRCLVNQSFSCLIIGQFLCAIGQPFILNAPTKIATRWFMQKNILKQRSLALALLSVINIIGTAVGFVVPTVFVQVSSGSEKSPQVMGEIRDQFWQALLLQFSLAAVATILNAIFFKQRPQQPPRYICINNNYSATAMAQHTAFLPSIKQLFTSKQFMLLMLSFGFVNGAFSIYGSLLEELLSPFGIESDQITILAATMMAAGIISAAGIGFYVELTLKYHLVFRILGVLGVLQTIGFVLVLGLSAQFVILLVLIILMGVLFIPIMPLGFDYGCDTMFPIGEAQITGTLMTSGQIIGIFFIVISQQLFGLGNNEFDQQRAAFNTTLFIGCFLLLGCLCFWLFKAQLKRSNLQRQFKKMKQDTAVKENQQ